MNGRSRLSRRGFCLAAGACLAVSWRLPDAAPLSAALAALVPEPRLAARLGACYLASRPAEAAGGEALCRLILPRAALRHAFMTAPPGRRIEMLSSLVAADFEAGRTAEVGGWILARTEARLAALVALV